MKDKYGNEYMLRVEGYGINTVLNAHRVVRVVSKTPHSSGYHTVWVDRLPTYLEMVRRKEPMVERGDHDIHKLLRGDKLKGTRWAHSTEEEAFARFRDRKKRQLQIVSQQWEDISKTLEMMGETKSDSELSKNIRTWIEVHGSDLEPFR